MTGCEHMSEAADRQLVAPPAAGGNCPACQQCDVTLQAHVVWGVYKHLCFVCALPLLLPLCPLQDVVWRVGSSFLGPLKPDFMSVTMTSPDLYGPFWVATTLIFVTAGVYGMRVL